MSGKDVAKGFIIGLLIFIGVSAGLKILAYAVMEYLETYFELFEDYPMLIFDLLFMPIAIGPSEAANLMAVGPSDEMLEFALNMMAYLLPGILAALVIGLIMDSKYEAFGAWVLVALTCFILIIIAAAIEEVVYLLVDYIKPNVITITELEEFIKFALFGFLVNIVFCGFFAVIVVRE